MGYASRKRARIMIDMKSLIIVGLIAWFLMFGGFSGNKMKASRYLAM
jgi:hypothetical protein